MDLMGTDSFTGVVSEIIYKNEINYNKLNYQYFQPKYTLNTPP